MGALMEKAKLGSTMVKYLKYVNDHAEKGVPESVLKIVDSYSEEEQLEMNIGKVKGKILDDAVN
jgi:hypothetical protein